MISELNPFINELQSSSNKNVFVMMRYRASHHFNEIESSIRESLKEFGLIARLAKDRALVDDLWSNIELYMKNSRFGIAVFEEIDDSEFNPNISLELGYMYAHGRRCLLLKESHMPRLPTDICGRIYRDFSISELKASVNRQVREWCSRDLGLQIIHDNSKRTITSNVVVYSNKSEDPEFRTWGWFSTVLEFNKHIQLNYEKISELGESSIPIIALIAEGTESIGINKSVPYLFGKSRFEYMALSSSAINLNLLFCMIPMQGEIMDNKLLEVGAQVCAEPANAYSPYRQRYFVPQNHVSDNKWHQAEIDFDFRKTPNASYSIFAPRINEGCPRPGSGKILIRNFELLIPNEDQITSTSVST